MFSTNLLMPIKRSNCNKLDLFATVVYSWNFSSYWRISESSSGEYISGINGWEESKSNDRIGAHWNCS